MHETPAELSELQRLLDRSAASQHRHMARIFTPERRLTAQQVARRLTGMSLLTLATVTSAGEPRTSPVDGLFFHGAFWFGTSPAALRARHIARNPAVSATHLPGESLAIVVHGRAERMDLTDPANAAFADHCRDIYDDDWNTWSRDSAYYRIDPERMYTFWMENDGAPGA